MTDQELNEMLASLIASQKETERILKESATRSEEERKKTEEERRKTEEERRKTERVIRQVNKQLGELGNKFGSFTEGMAFPSMEKILRNHFKMEVVTLRAKSQLNGHSIEIDVMAYDNGSRNEIYLVEVKSHLTRESIDQMLKTIEQFPRFFKAHRERTIYGIIAAVDIPDNLRGEVLNRGLHLARIHDGTFELLTPPGFKAAPFGPAAKQNGRTKKRPAAKK